MLRNLLCFCDVQSGNGRRHVGGRERCHALCCCQEGGGGGGGQNVLGSRGTKKLLTGAKKAQRDWSCSMRSFLAAQLPRGGKGEDGAARTGQPRGRKGKRRQGWCCCIEWKTKQEAAGGGNRILLTDVSRTIALVGRGVHGVWRDSEKEKQSRVEVDQRPASRSLRAPPIAFHYPVRNAASVYLHTCVLHVLFSHDGPVLSSRLLTRTPVFCRRSGNRNAR